MKADFLSTILERKQQEVEQSRKEVPEALLRERAARRSDHRPFFDRLAKPGPRGANIIAEIKRGSPSRGAIRPDLDPGEYARRYERGAAAAISVLTDREFFFGSPEDLKQARAAAQLPVLRKDFVLSEYQLYEAAAWGADAVLLIVRALNDAMLKQCLDLCGSLQLTALVEVHSEPELERASQAGARLVGINNRDLTTFQTDLRTSIRLARLLEPGQVAVAESGIKNRADIEQLLDAGIWNFLIGESLVRAPDPAVFLQQLLGKEQGG